MKFSPISIEEYVKKHLKNNPSENGKDLRKRLQTALADYKRGVKCSCGNDIWVIGAATVGNSCFTCITGESHPNNDYEIESAIKKNNTAGRRHIDEIPPSEINGFFDDDGYEISTDLIQKPSLCITCVHNDNPQEEILCNLTRIDQKDAKEFICFGYKERK